MNPMMSLVYVLITMELTDLDVSTCLLLKIHRRSRYSEDVDYPLTLMRPSIETEMAIKALNVSLVIIACALMVLYVSLTMTVLMSVIRAQHALISNHRSPTLFNLAF